MKQLIITRKENNPVETKVAYDLPAYFRTDSNEVLAVYSDAKVVRIQCYAPTLNISGFAIDTVKFFKNYLESAPQITEAEFLEFYDKAINVMEQTTGLVYRRSIENETADRDSEMKELINEEN